jgi:hypothetical protein
VDSRYRWEAVLDRVGELVDEAERRALARG